MRVGWLVLSAVGAGSPTSRPSGGSVSRRRTHLITDCLNERGQLTLQHERNYPSVLRAFSVCLI